MSEKTRERDVDLALAIQSYNGHSLTLPTAKLPNYSMSIQRHPTNVRKTDSIQFPRKADTTKSLLACKGRQSSNM